VHITGLQIKGLRNIDRVTVEPCTGVNLFFGINGAGKTTVLEAIYLTGNAKSFRPGYSQSLVNEKTTGFKVSANAIRGDGSLTDVEIFREGKVRKILINKARVVSRSSLVKQFPVMFFGHESLASQVSFSEARRGFFDRCLFHVEPLYHSHYADYVSALSQFKAGLRSGNAVQSIWNYPLASAGEQLHTYRLDCFLKLQKLFSENLDHFPDLPKVKMVYRSGWGSGHGLGEWLNIKATEHFKLGYCTVGPHRADLQIRGDKGEVKNWASRGQLKVYYGLYFLAFLRYLVAYGRALPIVLLDDLWAEMDESIAEKFLSLVFECNLQLFVSSIKDRPGLTDLFPIQRFHVERGTVC